MPHTRQRFIEKKALKKLRYSPVIAIQGARQTGKSFFVREIFTKQIADSKYITFDQDSAKDFAERDIESFMAKHEGIRPLIIDEAQKVPKIFDAVKFSVDQKRIPGSFVLLGSTEFSKLNLIRESLTGRISKLKFFPLTLAEAFQHKFNSTKKNSFFLRDAPWLNRKSVINHLSHGGLPGLFAVRSEAEKHAALEDWIQLTIYRDIHQFPKVKVESELCLKILRLVATEDEPTASLMAKELRVDLRKIKTHLSILETLFVIAPLPAHSMGTGKPIYYLFDVGISTFLNASIQKQLETLFLQEYLAKRSFEDESELNRQIFYYRTPHGGRLSFVEETDKTLSVIQIHSQARLNKKHFYLLEAFLEKAKTRYKGNKKVNALTLLSNLNAPVPKAVKPYLWESLG